jgi:hypothetical protein
MPHGEIPYDGKAKTRREGLHHGVEGPHERRVEARLLTNEASDLKIVQRCVSAGSFPHNGDSWQQESMDGRKRERIDGMYSFRIAFDRSGRTLESILYLEMSRELERFRSEALGGAEEVEGWEE